MDFYRRKNLWKLILLLFAVLIGAGTLWYTETFLEELREQEVKRAQELANAYNNLLKADLNTNVTFEVSIIESNTTIPVIITDENGNLMDALNVNRQKLEDPEELKRKIAEMEQEADPIRVAVNEERSEYQYLYYQNSILLTKLRLYPFVLLIIISLFLIIAYIAFSNARKAEQNQVWNGLAKETAHQIGTPLSSLMGWLEYLRGKGVDPAMVGEMEKDVNRLNMITERFSKIGSKPSLKVYNVEDVTREAVSYLQARSPRKIKISFEADHDVRDMEVKLNKPLFEWVIENLIRNAIDAIDREGKIKVQMRNTPKNVCIEVQDTGKGIPANKHKAIFRPGYTTKSRGWGLGLSLAKRIIEEYHAGRIFVAHSEVGKGTIFRILLRK